MYNAELLREGSSGMNRWGGKECFRKDFRTLTSEKEYKGEHVGPRGSRRLHECGNDSPSPSRSYRRSASYHFVSLAGFRKVWEKEIHACRGILLGCLFLLLYRPWPPLSPRRMSFALSHFRATPFPPDLTRTNFSCDGASRMRNMAERACHTVPGIYLIQCMSKML